MTEKAKFEKWNELPPEIKTECIQKLDIITRWNLRNTSKTERNLVDRQKIEIDEMSLSICAMLRMKVRLIEKDSILELNTNIDIPTHIPLIKFILRHGVFETIDIKSFITIDKLTELFPEKEFISVKNLVYFSDREEICLFWIEKVKSRLESIEIEYGFTSPGFLFSHEKIANAHYFQLFGCNLLQTIYKLAQSWIDNDAEIGREFLGEEYEDLRVVELKYFGKTFSKRVVSKTVRMFRIRMDNEEKHILISISTDDILRMAVIPAKMKESEYSDSGDFIRYLTEDRDEKPEYSDHDEDTDEDSDHNDYYDRYINRGGSD